MTLRRRILVFLWKLRGWISVLRSGGLRVGSRHYRRRVEQEQEHYGEVHESSDLCEPSPPVWNEIGDRVQELIRRRTGDNVLGHVVSRLRSREGARMVSLGSGACGVELEIARRAPGADVLCMDINPALLERGRQAAEAEGLRLRSAEADLNTVELPRAEFDVIFCHASLHHVLELERLIAQMRDALRPGGALVVVDVITRRGYRMWPETRKAVQALFDTLPARYRLNHTAYLPEKAVDRKIWDTDTRSEGMECLRSDQIVPLLERAFQVRARVDSHSICRRFFDTMYGPNYDLARPLDRAIVDWLWDLDRYYLETGALRPETFFGVYE